MELIRRERWLIFKFSDPQNVLSWALAGGGRRSSQAVAWYQVNDEELFPGIDPEKFLREKLEQTDFENAVGLMTSADLDLYTDVCKEWHGQFARTIATVGLSNALRAGDLPSGVEPKAGTINLCCQVSVPLSEEAMLEALGLACEARTAAVLSAGVRSTRSGLPATGTGTDCVVIACPGTGSLQRIAGKHTGLGHLIGASVEEAVRQGIKLWKNREKKTYAES